MQISKNTNNYTYIHGDFDKDGTPNIDDKYPFDKSRKQRVNKEVSLAKLFSYLDHKRHDAIIYGKYLKEKSGATAYRVKDNYSTINKLVRRNKFVSNDFIGLRFETDKRREARAKWNKFNKTHHVKRVPSKANIKKYNGIAGGEILGSENKYLVLGNSKNLYRAYHTNILMDSGKNTFGVESQFRTRKYGALNDAMHKRYKNGKSPSERQRFLSKEYLKQGF